MSKDLPRRGKILVVDDDEIFRCSLVVSLRVDCWHVMEARNGEEALKQVKAERPDVLLLDQRMPGISGTKVHELLRGEGFEIPTILVTAAADAEELARSAGIRHYLCKPIDFEELVGVLEEVA